MGRVEFSHKQVGKLIIDNGIDDAQWGYNLNAQTFPTYGGEVVQILSVYIDDLTLIGTVATYKQMEAIYSYFASYLQVATQGKNAQPGDGKTAYNLTPVYFAYPERDWFFKLYPKNVPGFRYSRETAAPTWQVSCHVVDDAPDLELIKEGIKALAQSNGTDNPLVTDKSGFGLKGQISPSQGNPDTDPFQTFTAPITQQQQDIQKFSEYYNSLIPAYAQGDFSAITAGLGAKPAFGQTAGNTSAGQNAPTTKLPPGKSSKSSSGGSTGSKITLPTTGSVPHNAQYDQHYKFVFNDMYALWKKTGSCSNAMVTRGQQWRAKALYVSFTESQAINDAVGAFSRSPYDCAFGN